MSFVSRDCRLIRPWRVSRFERKAKTDGGPSVPRCLLRTTLRGCVRLVNFFPASKGSSVGRYDVPMHQEMRPRHKLSLPRKTLRFDQAVVSRITRGENGKCRTQSISQEETTPTNEASFLLSPFYFRVCPRYQPATPDEGWQTMASKTTPHHAYNR
jgi:hypothetical protein